MVSLSSAGASRLPQLLTASLSSSLLLLLSLSLCLLHTPAVRAQVAAQNRFLKSDAIVPLRTHSIYAPYVDSDLQNKFWDFGGDAIVDTTRYIRLTQDRPSQAGWLWTRLPISVPNFEIVVEFGVDGKASGHHPSGDGFAFWLTEERAQPGPIFGSKDYYTGLGIMFDTFANARHPYTFPRVMLTNLNGVESFHTAKDGANQELAGCSVDIRRTKVASKFRLTYVKDVFLELALHTEEWDTWETCFKLRADNISMPVNPYIGLSAMTGDVSDNHDIVSVASSHIVYKPRSKAELAAERETHFGAGASGASKKKKLGSSIANFFGGNRGGGGAGDTKPSPAAGSYYQGAGSGSSRGGDGSSGPGFFSRLVFGFFSLLWTLLKWAAVVAVIGGAVFVFYQRKRKLDAKRF